MPCLPAPAYVGHWRSPRMLSICLPSPPRCVCGGAAAAAAADWGCATLLSGGLYVVRTDLGRLEGLLPELSPQDRGAELVEHTLRRHASLCFAALERRLLGTMEALSCALGEPAARRNGEAKRRLLAGGLAVMQAVLVEGQRHLLRRWVVGGCVWGGGIAGGGGGGGVCGAALQGVQPARSTLQQCRRWWWWWCW